jgi:hypothetical protein
MPEPYHQRAWPNGFTQWWLRARDSRGPCAEQSVNNLLPNIRYQEGLVRATSTKNPESKRLHRPTNQEVAGSPRFAHARRERGRVLQGAPSRIRELAFHAVISHAAVRVARRRSVKHVGVDAQGGDQPIYLLCRIIHGSTISTRNATHPTSSQSSREPLPLIVMRLMRRREPR